MQKNQENQCAVFEKNAENLQFWAFLTILAQNLDRRGPKCPSFEFSWKKQKRQFFTPSNTSIHAKNQGNPICGFQNKWGKASIWAFLTILAQNGRFWTDTAQNVQFSNFPGKNKNVTFLHSLRLAFMQKIRKFQCAVSEKI